MKLVKTLSVLVAAILLVSATAWAGATTTKFTLPFNVLHPCTGELIVGEITHIEVFHPAQDANGGIHDHVSFTVHGQAVGQISGLKYVFKDNAHEEVNIQADGLPATLEFRARLRVIAQGDNPDDDFVLIARDRFHLDNNGEVRQNSFSFSAVCE